MKTLLALGLILGISIATVAPVFASPVCGDVDGNGKVDSNDVKAFETIWGKGNVELPYTRTDTYKKALGVADFNRDGFLDRHDRNRINLHLSGGQMNGSPCLQCPANPAPCKPQTTPTSAPRSSYSVCGDVDGNGKVDSNDVKAFETIWGKGNVDLPYTRTDTYKKALGVADFNRDGFLDRHDRNRINLHLSGGRMHGSPCLQCPANSAPCSP